MASLKSSARSSLQMIRSPEQMIDMLEERWRQANKRSLVSCVRIVESCRAPLPLISLPEWPGLGEVTTVADGLPAVVIPDMPAAAYLDNIVALSAYTLAELACTRPQLANQIWREELVRLALVTVATRAGAWAALNRTPVSAETVSSSVIRWSRRTSSMIVRPASIGDGTELWRHFLASSPGMPPVAVEVAHTLAGVAPLQFLSGAALLIQAGEVYAMHYLEQAVSETLRAALSPQAQAYLRLSDRGLWDTMGAAAIGGFRASVIRSVATDPAYVTAANMRVPNAGLSAMHQKLDRIKSMASTVHMGFPNHIPVARRDTVDHSAPAQDDDDTISIADTEALGEFHASTSRYGTPRAGTPQPMASDVADQLLSSVRAIPRPVETAASAYRVNPDEGSVQW